MCVSVMCVSVCDVGWSVCMVCVSVWYVCGVGLCVVWGSVYGVCVSVWWRESVHSVHVSVWSGKATLIYRIYDLNMKDKSELSRQKVCVCVCVCVCVREKER